MEIKERERRDIDRTDRESAVIVEIEVELLRVALVALSAAAPNSEYAVRARAILAQVDGMGY